MVGSGFNAKFHLLGFVGVRDADVLGVWSPNATNAAATAGIARQLGVGDAKPYPSIASMVEDPAIDAIWLSGPNHARVENVAELVSAIERGRANPTVESLERLALVLGVRVGELFEEAEGRR